VKTRFFSLFIFLFLSSALYAQTCLSEGIVFTTQSQVDSFTFNYPGCTTIEGSVFINGSDITHIDSLYTIQVIEDSLGIYYSFLVDLSGLENLTSIGDYVGFFYNNSLESVEALSGASQLSGLTFIFQNQSLLSYQGLAGIIETSESILLANNSVSSLGLLDIDSIQGHFSIQNHTVLGSLSGIQNLKYVGGSFGLNNNPQLFTLEGLNDLDYIGGSFSISGIQISNLDPLESLNSVGALYLSATNLTDLSGLSNTSIHGGSLQLVNNEFLVSLEGLGNPNILFGLGIHNNPLLSDLTGLNQLDTVSYFFQLDNNPSLENFLGLENLKYVGGDFGISNCNSILDLTGLDSIEFVGGSLSFHNNLLLSDISALDSLDINSVDGLYLSGNSNLSYCTNYMVCNYLQAFSGLSSIYNNAQGCNSVEEVTYYCEFGLCPDGDIYLSSQEEIDNYSEDFEFCTTISGSLIIEGSDIVNLDSLYLINSIEGDLIIGDTIGNPLLNDILGLLSLSNIDGDLVINNNDVLESLAGLDNIEAATIHNLSILNNPQLSECDISSICSFITLSDSLILIENNGEECNSIEEVEIECALFPCLENGIFFYDQSEVDDFPSNYPGCDEILGSVYISSYDISNLDSLIQLRSIGGNLNIYGDYYYSGLLTSLTGLDNLEYIGGILELTELGIHNLEGLNNLDSIGEYAYIYACDSLVNFNGLTNLKSIAIGLDVDYCESLQSLDGLESLTYVGGLGFSGNENLVDLNGLQFPQSEINYLYFSDNENIMDISVFHNLTRINDGLTFYNNSRIQSFYGLHNIDSINGSVRIQYNDSLEYILGLEELNYIGGDLLIRSNSSISSLEGLNSLLEVEGSLNLSGLSVNSFVDFINLESIGDGMYIENCNSIHDLAGFEGISNLGGNLSIRNNDSLLSLNGLQHLNAIGGSLYIGGPYNIGNDLLTSLDSLYNLQQIDGGISIRDNSSLQSLSGLDNIIANSIEYLSIVDNPNLSVCSVESVCDYIAESDAEVNIQNNNVNCNSYGDVYLACAVTCEVGDLSFTSQEEIDSFSIQNPDCISLEGDVTISGNDITNLNGLSSIEFIRGGLWITNNSTLENLDGLENLLYVEDQLNIGYNPLLQNVSGLQGLDSIGGDLKIINNQSLTSLTALIGLQIVGGELRIVNNDELSNLEGLNSIQANSLDELTITLNDLLSNCAIESVCNYLSSPNGQVSISNNSSGCDSELEVETACIALSIDETNIIPELTIYPNPATSLLNIELTSNSSIDELSIYNQIGQLIYFEDDFTGPIDAKDFESGIYIIEISSNNAKFIEKLILK